MSEHGYLNVKNQRYPHDELLIVGDENGLHSLLATIQKALDTGYVLEETPVEPGDGEYYDIGVSLLTDTQFQEENFDMPYTDAMYPNRDHSHLSLDNHFARKESEKKAL